MRIPIPIIPYQWLRICAGAAVHGGVAVGLGEHEVAHFGRLRAGQPKARLKLPPGPRVPRRQGGTPGRDRRTLGVVGDRICIDEKTGIQTKYRR